MESGLEDRNNDLTDRGKLRVGHGLNGVRPRRPEQSASSKKTAADDPVSMESGLEDRNNHQPALGVEEPLPVSMESGLEDRNNSSPRKATLARNFTSARERSASRGPI